MSICKITSFLKADLASRVEEVRSKFVVGSQQLACHKEIQHTGDKWLKTHQYSQCDDYVKHDHVLQNEADVFKVFLMLTKTHGREIVEEFITNGKRIITVRDFTRAVDDLRMPGISFHDVAACWPLFDANGDGDVTLDEFQYTLANYRILLKRLYSNDNAIEKTRKGTLQFQTNLRAKFYNAPPTRPRQRRTIVAHSPRIEGIQQVDHELTRNSAKTAPTSAAKDEEFADIWFLDWLDMMRGRLDDKLLFVTDKHNSSRNRMVASLADLNASTETMNAITSAISTITQKRRVTCHPEQKIIPESKGSRLIKRVESYMSETSVDAFGKLQKELKKMNIDGRKKISIHKMVLLLKHLNLLSTESKVGPFSNHNRTEEVTVHKLIELLAARCQKQQVNDNVHYQFSLDERRFLFRMKLWVETGVKLSRSNIFFTIFNTFSPHEIYKSNDTIIPIETLIESIGGGDLLLKWRKFVLNLERLDTQDRGGNIVGGGSTFSRARSHVRKFYRALLASRKN
jgi:predicted RNA binding protein with dsRBD fold (UPF0201 family)